MAQELGSGEETVDPFGGRGDLEGRRLRMVSAEAFTRDPLRSLRLVRLACELRFEIEGETAAAARAGAALLAQVSPERIFEEFRRILIAPDARRGLELMDELGVTDIVLPELGQLRGIEQSRFHHLDVHAHTLSVLTETIELERTAERDLGPHWQEVNALLNEPLANQLTRWQAMRFGAVLHDIAKPQTRGVTPDGRVTFMGHDAAGAETAVAILARMRASQRLREYVAALVRHHLRLGFMVHERPLPRRSIYRYLKSLGDYAVDVTVLTMADRRATQGARSEEAIAAHLELARQMLGEALAWRADPPRPPLRGDELAAALGLTPGPALGAVLAELEEASFADGIVSREEAVERARVLLDRRREQSVDR
jgi:putative nucleotidyltransferase with HDIG domain